MVLRLYGFVDPWWILDLVAWIRYQFFFFGVRDKLPINFGLILLVLFWVQKLLIFIPWSFVTFNNFLNFNISQCQTQKEIVLIMIVHALDKEIGYVNCFPSTSINSSFENYLSCNKLVTNDHLICPMGFGLKWLAPQSTPPTTYGPRLPSPQSSKTSWTKLPRSNSAYPINPTLIKTFTSIESMMFISQNVSSNCTINRSKMN